MKRIWFSIPAVVLACATSSPNEQTSGTRRAQDGAQQQYQDAANAQKRAAEEQKKAEQAEQNLTKAQKALADAQATLEGQRAKAAQAQRDAGRLARDAQERGAQMQEQATQLQGQEARQGKRTQQENQQAWMQTRNVRGAITAVGPDALTVRSVDQGDVRLQVNDSTAINLDGQTSSMNAIRAGADVRASYGVIDGQPMAVRLDVTSAPK
jgi:uncharacterized phage infection (PIP) family protein YhgE